jgi:hypothetical protein
MHRSKRNGYSITSSASAISLTGMFKLSVFAVMRLMTNSRLHHRQIGGLFTFEDATSIDADQPVHRRSHHFVGEDPVMIAITPPKIFSKEVTQKQATPLTAPATPSHQKSFYAKFPGMRPG